MWLRLILRGAIVLTAVTVAVLFAVHTLARTWHSYDDEGYALISLDHYLSGGALYTEVFSHYGPLHFFVQEAIFRALHLPLSHDSGRFVMLGWWLFSGTLGGLFIYRLSNDITLATAAGLACIRLGSVLTGEPGHPQQMILGILMVSCCASVVRGAEKWNLIVLGGLGAALLFTKINIGIFYFASLAVLVVAAFGPSLFKYAGIAATLAYAVGAPALLMHRDLSWASDYCLLAIICTASTFVAAFLVTPASREPRRLACCLSGGALATCVLIVLWAFLRGMSSGSLLEGVLWGPLRQPGFFSYPLNVPLAAVCNAVVVSTAISAIFVFRDKSWMPPEVFAALRLVAGLATISVLTVNRDAMVWVLPLFPLALLPVPGARPSDIFPRVLVTTMAVTQFLQAYPVAGSQLGIAAEPMLLCGFICLYDGSSGLLAGVKRSARQSGFGASRISVAGTFLSLVLGAGMYGAVTGSQSDYPASHLRGASSLHLPPAQENSLRFLAANVHQNCDYLLTLPGMASLNYWSSVPALNGFNTTGWMRTLPAQRQTELLTLLRAQPRACVIYDRKLSDFWGSPTAALNAAPLPHYILNDMPMVAGTGDYEIRAQPDRNSRWVTSPGVTSPWVRSVAP